MARMSSDKLVRAVVALGVMTALFVLVEDFTGAPDESVNPASKAPAPGPLPNVDDVGKASAPANSTPKNDGAPLRR